MYMLDWILKNNAENILKVKIDYEIRSIKVTLENSCASAAPSESRYSLFFRHKNIEHLESKYFECLEAAAVGKAVAAAKIKEC